jgi:hypothetical protein
MYIYTCKNKVKKIDECYYKDNKTYIQYLLKKKFDTRIIEKPLKDLKQMLNKIIE